MARAGSDADGVQGAGLERGLRPALLLPHVLHHAGGADPPPCNTHPSALCPTRGLSIGTSQLDLTAAHTRWRAQVVNTGSLSGDCARNGLYKYSQNYWKDWTNSWMIWCALRKPALPCAPPHPWSAAEKIFVRRLPGYTGAFVMPPHLRMPWIASVSFGYVCLLSFTRGDYKPTQPPNDG